MGKHKKKFIEKKNAVTFHLVHRSQHDPLITDTNAPQHVLVEATKSKPTDPKKQKEEQEKYGIFFDDDYDYLQHLKEPAKDVIWEYIEAPNQKKDKEPPAVSPSPSSSSNANKRSILLPSSVFATTYQEDEGMLNKAAPNPGPKPDWDPDVVAALDDDFDFDNPDNELEDDFVLKAMDNNDDGDDDNDNESNFNESDEDRYIDSDGPFSDDEDDDSDISGDDEMRDRLAPLMREKRFDKEELKSRFTEYSMSSSVIRRNEQLSLLDDRFEKFYSSYDDPEVGALDMDEIEGYMDHNNPLVLKCIREFKKPTKFERYNKNWDKERIKKYSEINSSEEDEMEDMQVKDDKQKKWDCESILSTYSNIYNHPKLIEEPRRKNKNSTKIEIDPKTGIPKNVLRGGDKLTMESLAKHNMNDNDPTKSKIVGPKSLCDKSVLSTLSVLSIRPKDETEDEKRERKRLLREYRAERRMEKKANREAFKEEKKRQEKIKINQMHNLQGKKIL